MNRSIILLVVFCTLMGNLQGQYVIRDAGELDNLMRLPQEKVFIHHTGPIIFTGEYLNYAFYCFNARTLRASDVSFVGYVALVNGKGQVILEQKVRLESGLSQGDFFIGTDVPSGTYKLLGYTHWMKNNGLQQVFKDDIVVINPYNGDQSGLLPIKGQEKGMSVKARPQDSSLVQLMADKKQYGTREKVTLSLKNYKEQLGHGNFTIKVVKKEQLASWDPLNAISYSNQYLNVGTKIDKKVGDSLYLPEQRGELLHGKVVDGETGEPVLGATAVISVPGEGFLLKFAQTDSSGNFYTYLRKEYQESRAIVQLMDSSNVGWVPVVVGLDGLDLAGLNFPEYRLDASKEAHIRERSIRNQLENQFYRVKPDSVLREPLIDSFDGGIPEIFELDDYTRFPTFGETLVEVLDYAGYRTNDRYGSFIRIAQDFETYDERANSFPSIVLIDGVFIPDHEKIRDFDSGLIKSISLIRDKFRLAGKDYQGMMVIHTFSGRYFEEYQPDKGINVPINKSQPQKRYFKQSYAMGGNIQKQIPDYRTLLFWQPHLELKDNEHRMEFFTSDVTGEFEVVLDGFTTYGKPISVYRTISVTSRANGN